MGTVTCCYHKRSSPWELKCLQRGLNENLSTFSDQINTYILSLYISKLKEFKSLDLKYGYVFLPQNSTWMHQMLNV